VLILFKRDFLLKLFLPMMPSGKASRDFSASRKKIPFLKRHTNTKTRKGKKEGVKIFKSLFPVENNLFFSRKSLGRAGKNL